MGPWLDLARRRFGCRRLRLPGVVLGLLTAAAFTSPSPIQADLLGHGGMVRAITVSSDGRYALSGSFDFSAILWDFGEQVEMAVLDAHDAPVNDVAFLPDNKHAVTVSDDGTAIVWSLGTTDRPVVKHRLTGHTHKVMALSVSPSNGVIATGGWDKTVRLWGSGSGEETLAIEAGTPVNALAFSYDGRWLAIGGHDGRVQLWDMVAKQFSPALTGHAMGITRLAASPNDGRLLSAGIDGTVRLWDMDQGVPLQVFEWHEKQAFTVSFLPDGKSALSAGREGELVVWSLQDAVSPRRIAAHDAMIWSTAVTPDGRFALSASTDETVRVWHLETGDRIGPMAEAASEPQPWLDSDHPGAQLFTKCARCHNLSATGVRRSGPHFEGLFGRTVGQIEGYNYSEALQRVNFQWNAETLTSLFSEGPDVFLPGTKMPVQRVTSAEDLEHLIDFLRIVTQGSP